MAVTELAVWGRRQAAAASRRAGYVSGIHAAASATGTEVTHQVADQLTRLLDLSACRFQYGVAGVGVAARLNHGGRVVVDKREWPVESRGFPPGDVELLVETGGYLRGRFLMTPAAGSRPALENRLVAVALADQVGAALIDR